MLIGFISIKEICFFLVRVCTILIVHFYECTVWNTWVFQFVCVGKPCIIGINGTILFWGFQICMKFLSCDEMKLSNYCFLNFMKLHIFCDFLGQGYQTIFRLPFQHPQVILIHCQFLCIKKITKNTQKIGQNGPKIYFN